MERYGGKTNHATSNGVQNSTAIKIIAPDNVRTTIDETYDVIEKQMLASIPCPQIQKKHKRKLHEWPECWRMQQSFTRTQLIIANAKHVIYLLNRKWTSAIRMMTKSTNQHYSRRVCYDRRATIISQNFYSRPIE